MREKGVCSLGGNERKVRRDKSFQPLTKSVAGQMVGKVLLNDQVWWGGVWVSHGVGMGVVACV